MTPERWRQVTAIFHAARAREPERRGALLDQMCGQDASLRGEVESLLAAQARTGQSGQAALSIDLLPQLSPGTAFGAYRVDALVGAGGMGQVYRATDTRLRRTVAIKVLPPGLSDDPDFDARFEREARLLASLSHPNIAAIHGLEEAGGVQGLVLEFVEGPTLAERLATGRLPVPEALGIAKQIALALEAAHEKSIIHRDLKPANIKITPNGVVKVLDFGIAKVADAGRSMLTTALGTDTGIILGTPAYMSPEQARGLVVDKRTDVWAFGCVLFEMLTGRGAFFGDTASDSLAKVIEREPDWSALPPSVPPQIRRLLARCLQKDPADRLRDVGDARIEISETLAPPVVAETGRTVTAVRKIPAVLILAGVVLVAVGTWALWKYLPSTGAPSSSPPSMEFGVTFPTNVVPAFGVAVSPDGRRIAVGGFVNSSQIWLHSFEPPETRRLAGADGNWPFWSPDGTSIGFFGLGKLHIISASGGTARTLADAVGFVGGDWSTSGVILYCSSGRFFSIPASGGTPKDLGLKGITGSPAAPRFLPDGRHFVFYEVRLGAGGVMRLASLDAETVTDLVPSELVGTFAPPDQLLFVRNTTLFAQRLDTRRFVLIGEPAAIASGVIRGVVDEGPSLSPSASANGTLAFQAPRGGNRGQLTWFDRDGKVQSVIESPSDNAEYLNPAISPDGAFVAATRIDPDNGTADIWQIDVARRVASKLTTDAGAENDVVWSHDGRYIAYRAVKAGKGGLYRQSLAGGAPELLLDASDALALPTDFSPDGRYLLFQRSERFWRMWALPLSGDRVPVPLASDQSSSYGGHLSPDGKWLAYNSGETGQFEIVVRRFLSDGPTTQISNGGGVHPRWTRGGKEIVYWTPPRGIFANDISITGSEIRVGPTRTLVDRPVASLIDGRPHFDVTGDGQRLLVRQPAGPPGPGIRVIVNWMSKIAK